MTTAASRHPETARWCRATEWLMFALPVAAGVALVGLAFLRPRIHHLAVGDLLGALSARPVAALVGLALAVVVGVIWTLGLAAAVYLDAAAVEAVAAGWDPRGSAYAALVLVVPVAALGYLRRRHRHLGVESGGEAPTPWWLGFPVASAVIVLAFVGVARGDLPPVAVLAGAGLAVTVLPIAAYRDATSLGRTGAGWRPDPAVHFVLASVAALLAFPLPVYAAYYLLRRGRALRGDENGGRG